MTEMTEAEASKYDDRKDFELGWATRKEGLAMFDNAFGLWPAKKWEAYRAGYGIADAGFKAGDFVQ